jgi:hypothetical protein
VGRTTVCGIGIGVGVGARGSGVCSIGDGISLRLESVIELNDPGMVLIGGTLERALMLVDLPLSEGVGPTELLLDEYEVSD